MVEDEGGFGGAAGHYEHNNMDSNRDTERRRMWRKGLRDGKRKREELCQE